MKTLKRTLFGLLMMIVSPVLSFAEAEEETCSTPVHLYIEASHRRPPIDLMVPETGAEMSIVKTGDTQSVVFWIGMIAAALLACGCVWVLRKKIRGKNDVEEK